MSLTRNIRRASITLFAAALAFALAPVHSANAKGKKGKAAGAKAKKAKPACGINYLPLVVGNEWVYEPMDPPEATPGQQPGKRKRWPTVKPPAKVTIKVTKIEPDGKKAQVITLEETADKDTRTVTFRCTAKSLEMSPQSFWYAGSPGGGFLMTLENVQRTGKPFPGKAGLRNTTGWTETITADVVRAASKGTSANHPKASVTVERSVLVEGTQEVNVSSGAYKKSTRVRIDLSGRATVEQPKKRSVEIPAAQVGVLWFYNKVGVVQTRDSVGRWFQLTSKTLN